MGSIDESLLTERVGPARSKRTFLANIDDLTDGVFGTLDKDEGRAHLLREEQILEWSPGEYNRARTRQDEENVSVLTLSSTVAAIRAG